MNVREHNMEYLNLDDEQYNRHIELLQMPQRDWPQSLKDHCQKVSNDIGWCGDVMMCAVADWIREQTDIQDGA